ncbi:MAG: hypothetical protein PHF70_02345 [Opitutales bacterium]|nr:hypothetical protein [Opitutales bacterium]
MNTRSIFLASTLSILAACHAHASQDNGTLLQTRMWTDRNLTNPALSVPESTINQSIERFWNLPERPLPETPATQPTQPARSPYMQHRCRRYACSEPITAPAVPPHRDHLAQQQSNNQRRGFLGINLFNLIPIVDIVYGKAETTSSDHVNSYK